MFVWWGSLCKLKKSLFWERILWCSFFIFAEINYKRSVRVCSVNVRDLFLHPPPQEMCFKVKESNQEILCKIWINWVFIFFWSNTFPPIIRLTTIINKTYNNTICSVIYIIHYYNILLVFFLNLLLICKKNLQLISKIINNKHITIY